jgi:hypothetical protein
MPALARSAAEQDMYVSLCTARGAHLHGVVLRHALLSRAVLC